MCVIIIISDKKLSVFQGVDNYKNQNAKIKNKNYKAKFKNIFQIFSKKSPADRIGG